MPQMMPLYWPLLLLMILSILLIYLTNIYFSFSLPTTSALINKTKMITHHPPLSWSWKW